MSDRAITRRVAIITGASRRQGIGAAICRALAKRGTDVFFTHWTDADAWSPDPDGPAALLSELRALGVRAASIPVDLADADAATVVLDEVARQLGQPTVLVNNAAHSAHDGFMALDAATLDAHYAVNLRTTALLSVEFARRHVYFQQEHEDTTARIINMTSGQGLGAMPGELAYVATKGAIDALTITLAAELAPHSITVNAVDPGATDTGWMTREFAAELRRQSPTGRIGQPGDAARLVTFLASDEAEWITGQVIRSRGGMG